MTDSKNKEPGSLEDLQASRKSRDAAKKRLAERESELERSNVELEELRSFKSEVESEREEQEQKRLEAKGEYDKLSSKKDAEIAKLKKSSEEASVAADKRLSDALIPTKIAALIAGDERTIYGADDIVALIKGKFTLDENGDLASEDGEPTEVLEAFLKDRPQNLGVGKKGDLKIKTGEPVKKDWDIDKAMNSPAYADEWAEADQEGYDKAVDAAMAG